MDERTMSDFVVAGRTCRCCGEPSNLGMLLCYECMFGNCSHHPEHVCEPASTVAA